MEVFKAELKKTHATEIEQLKSDLKSTAFERQTRFAKLHETRAEVVAELYKLLVVADSAVRKLLDVEPSENEEYKRMFVETGKKTTEFSNFFEERRIYFDEELCKLIDTHTSNFSQAWLYGSPFAERIFGDREVIKKQLTELIEAIPAVRHAIEKRMREMLGV